MLTRFFNRGRPAKLLRQFLRLSMLIEQSRKIKSTLSYLGKEILKETWIFILILVIFSFLLRLWHLGAIKEEIFDEVYFIDFAKNYLAGTSFFDIHPPLGKLILAVGIRFFEDQFGWRIMAAIFCTGL